MIAGARQAERSKGAPTSVRRRLGSLAGLLAAGLGALTLVASCAGAPEVRYYELSPPAAGRGSMTAVTGVEGATGVDRTEGVRIGVERFRVDPPYDQNRIVYRIASEANEVGFYAYHRWATPLESMLALAAARLLESRPGVALAEPVEPADPEAAYDLLVGGRLLELDEVDGPDGEEARVELELTLRVPDGGSTGADGGSELWRGRYRATAAGTAGDVAAVVALMEQALAEALGRGTDELVRHLSVPADPIEAKGSNAPASR